MHQTTHQQANRNSRSSSQLNAPLKRRQLIQALSAAPLLGLPVASGLISTLASSPASAAEGKPLPLDHYVGKVVLADFWASWCGPCRLSMPWLNQMHEKYADQGLHILGVNLDEDAASAARFLKSYPASFEVLYDPKGEYASHYALMTMPTSILFDRNGQTITQHRGFLTDQTADYEAGLVAALKA